MRKTTWAMIAWSAAIAAWIVSILARTGPHCTHERFHSVCETDSGVSKGIGVFLLAAVWLLGFLVLAAVRFLAGRRAAG